VFLIGNKGVGLCEMTSLGLPVPNGFVISSEVSSKSTAEDFSLSDDIKLDVKHAILDLQRKENKMFGVCDDQLCSKPLLVSVRAGAAILNEQVRSECCIATEHVHFSVPESWSYPGVIRSVLNLGINDSVQKKLAKEYGPVFALDTHARFLMSYGTAVLGANYSEYSCILHRHPADPKFGYSLSDLQSILEKFKRIRDVPDDPWEQVSVFYIPSLRE